MAETNYQKFTVYTKDTAPSFPALIYDQDILNAYKIKEKVAKRKKTFKYQAAADFVRPLMFVDLNEYAEWILHSRDPATSKTPFINRNGITCPKAPPALPFNPKNAYTILKQWVDSAHFLIGEHANKQDKPKTLYWSYELCKSFIHQLKFNSKLEWYYWCRLKPHMADTKYTIINDIKFPTKPRGIPSNPEQIFKITGDWISWNDWLNCEELLVLDDIRYEYSMQYARNNELFTKEQYNKKAEEDPKLLKYPLVYAQKHGLLNSWNDFVNIPKPADYLKHLKYDAVCKLTVLGNVNSVEDYAKMRTDHKLEKYLLPSIYDYKEYEGYNSKHLKGHRVDFKLKVMSELKPAFCIVQGDGEFPFAIHKDKSIYHILLNRQFTKHHHYKVFAFEMPENIENYNRFLHTFTRHISQNNYQIPNFYDFIGECRKHFTEIDLFLYPHCNEPQNKSKTRPRCLPNIKNELRLADHAFFDLHRTIEKDDDESLYARWNAAAAMQQAQTQRQPK